MNLDLLKQNKFKTYPHLKFINVENHISQQNKDYQLTNQYQY